VIVATANWVNPLIAALAALGRALVGATAVIWTTLHAERIRREQERAGSARWVLRSSKLPRPHVERLG